LRARLAQLACACVLVTSAVLAACGGDDDADLAAMVPPDVPLYGEAVLRPDDDQREAIESLTSRVAGIDDPGGQIVAALDESLAEEPGGLTYEDDIEPWLGDRLAFFVRSFEGNGAEPDGAALIEVGDADAAQDFIDRAAEADPEFPGTESSYRGNDYLLDEGDFAVGLVDDVLVAGTEEAFKVVVDAGDGESLAESEDYQQRNDPLDEDALGFVYLDLTAAVEGAVAAGTVDPQDARLAQRLLSGPFAEAFTLSVSATEDSATVDAVTAVDGVDAALSGDMLDGLPAGSWLAAAVPDLGPMLQRWVDEIAHSGLPGAGSFEDQVEAESGLNLSRDVFDWLGGAAVFVRGTEVPGLAAGLIAETSTPQGPRKLVELVQEIAEADSGLRSAAPPEGTDYGFSLGLPGLGGGAEVGVTGDSLVAAFGTTVGQVLDPDETLAEDERFQAVRDRLGDDFAPWLYLDIQDAYKVGELDPTPEPGYEQARAYVEQLGSFIAGTRVDDELLVSRLILTLAQ
jgi:hypothetical protein